MPREGSWRDFFFFFRAQLRGYQASQYLAGQSFGLGVRHSFLFLEAWGERCKRHTELRGPCDIFRDKPTESGV